MRAAGAEERFVEIGQRARWGMHSQVFMQPFALRGKFIAPAGFEAFAIQYDDMPAAELVAVVAFARFTGRCTKILEVICGAGGMKLVITRRWPSTILHASPVFVVAS